MNRLRALPQLLFLILEIICLVAIIDRFAALSGFLDVFPAIGKTYLICIGVMLLNVLLHPLIGFFDYTNSVYDIFVGAIFAPVFFAWKLIKHPFAIIKVLIVGQKRKPMSYRALFSRYFLDVAEGLEERSRDTRETDLGGPLGMTSQLQKNLRAALKRICVNSSSYHALGWDSGPRISEGLISSRVTVKGRILFSKDATSSDISDFLDQKRDQIVDAVRSTLQTISKSYKGYDGNYTVEVDLDYRIKG